MNKIAKKDTEFNEDIIADEEKIKTLNGELIPFRIGAQKTKVFRLKFDEFMNNVKSILDLHVEQKG